MTLAQVPQFAPPALWADTRQLAFAWVGADDTRIHQDIAVYNESGLSQPSALVLPPLHPFDQQVFPAVENRYHLLWLDRDNESDGLRLFGATVTPELIAEIGPTALSDQTTLRYSAVVNGDNSLWIVWSGGVLSEPSLQIVWVDPAGRPRFPEFLISDGDYPSLVRSRDGVLYLYWWSRTNNHILRGRLNNGVLEDVQRVVESVRLERGDHLTHLRAGMDATHAYLFWNVRRANGSSEVWWAAGEHKATTWQTAQLLRIMKWDGNPIQTGFNSGEVKPVTMGENVVRWATPINEEFALLPVAVNVNEELGVLYFQRGQMIGYQTITYSGVLFDAPALKVDRDLHLYLAWSQPHPFGYAELNLTMTKRW